MIDSLFGSRTRVKLLGLFMNNPTRSFYVREIARNIDEQLNSVRRELANLTEVGVVEPQSVENRLYYCADTSFKYYGPLREMFTDSSDIVSGAKVETSDWAKKFANIPGLKVVIFAGCMVYESKAPVDLLIAGSQMSELKLKNLVKQLERESGASLNYSIMDYNDFYYRLSINDRFVLNILEAKHTNVVDANRILGDYPGTEHESAVESVDKGGDN